MVSRSSASDAQTATLDNNENGDNTMPIEGNNMHGDKDAPTEANFRAFVDYLFQAKRQGMDGFHHAASGLAGESGEVLDHTKKAWVYGRELDLGKVVEEMGDTLHYYFMLMIKLEEHTGVRFTLADFISHNMVKLRKRYPNGYSKEAALARADKV